MAEQWKVTVLGVRGAIPMPAAEFLRYGGHTSCITVDCGEELVVLDAGSGLSQLNPAPRPDGKARLDILLSHLHLDHVMGLFGCRQLYDPEAEIHLYGEARAGVSLRTQLETLLGPPYWPLGLKDFSARIELHEVGPGEAFRLVGRAGQPGVTVHTLRGNHPNQSLLYRLEAGNKRVTYALDCETDETSRPALEEFAQDSALLIWAANFTAEDLARRPGWGHSSWQQGAALGAAAGVGLTLMTHYSWEYPDGFLQEQERLASRTGSWLCFAREGMEIQI